jgi:CBS domain-containing protein
MSTQPIQHIHRRRGMVTLTLPPCAVGDPVAARSPTIADTVPVTWVMTREVICAAEDLDVDTILDLLVGKHVGCVPVVDGDGRPVGMITKLDIVEQILAVKDPEQDPALDAGRLMMPLALTLDEHATMAHAAALMAAEDVHHVPIVEECGRLIGVISSLDVVRWLAANDGYLPGAERAS